MRRLRSMVAALAFATVAVGVEAAAAETRDDDEVPMEAGFSQFQSACLAAGGVAESGPWHERDGTLTECVRTYTVRQGDWLWKVSRASLRDRDARPTRAAVKKEADRIYEANKATIGPNPNRLLVGQKLRVLALNVSLRTRQGPIAR